MKWVGSKGGKVKRNKSDQDSDLSIFLSRLVVVGSRTVEQLEWGVRLGWAWHATVRNRIL